MIYLEDVPAPDEHTLEFLLAFDGRIHHLEEGYWLKFEIARVEPTPERPHGLRYALTLHRGRGDAGRTYKFTTADQLLADFFDAVRRALEERGISDAVVKETNKQRKDSES